MGIYLYVYDILYRPIFEKYTYKVHITPQSRISHKPT